MCGVHIPLERNKPIGSIATGLVGVIGEIAQCGDQDEDVEPEISEAQGARTT